MPETCPLCGACLTGEPIPEELREHYGGATHYCRAIGVSDPDADRVVAWVCPFCTRSWQRGQDAIQRETLMPWPRLSRALSWLDGCDQLLGKGE